MSAINGAMCVLMLWLMYALRFTAITRTSMWPNKLSRAFHQLNLFSYSCFSFCFFFHLQRIAIEAKNELPDELINGLCFIVVFFNLILFYCAIALALLGWWGHQMRFLNSCLLSQFSYHLLFLLLLMIVCLQYY